MDNPPIATIMIGDSPQVWECRDTDGRMVGWIERGHIGYVAVVGTGKVSVVVFEAALNAVERMVCEG